MARAISTSYLSTIFYPETFAITVRKSLDAAFLLQRKHNFDTIAFCGMSGAAMSFILAHEMNIPLLCVRKRGESSHYVNSYEERYLEGNVAARKFLLVDDFISSGKTVNYILDTIKKDIPEATCVAMLMYAGYGGDFPYRRVDEKGDEIGQWDVIQPRKDGEY